MLRRRPGASSMMTAAKGAGRASVLDPLGLIGGADVQDHAEGESESDRDEHGGGLLERERSSARKAAAMGVTTPTAMVAAARLFRKVARTFSTSLRTALPFLVSVRAFIPSPTLSAPPFAR